ncbi:bile acid:sodium symporter family protein [Thalassotalea psychrophila]|uniref:Bile acid:sodium symporter family protein n=1 Tax=Thalassotalea psychrophila TaxID=3065647 RepID=A0ABY9U0C5_9GAMM|nr:bile acid:sodium symporter family protein [Colwelliaceae bacterium SQ149]
MFLKLFPLWAVLAAMSGFVFPEQLSELKSTIIPLLTVVMLCMGLTLRPKDFIDIPKYKVAMIAGMVLQFSVMPFSALLISIIFGFSTELTIGLVLVGSVAGGVSSNVMTYIAGGNVAMSVSMTAVSTLLSVVMTPLLLTLLVGSSVEVPAMAMLLSLLKIILIPVSIGVAVNSFAHKYVERISGALAPFTVFTILMVIAIVVALNADRLESIGYIVVFATLLHNIIGMVLGYSASHLLGFDEKVSRTIAIEVGMQNSALATALALKFFTPAAALPGAIFSIWLNITGSIFASICLKLDQKKLAKQNTTNTVESTSVEQNS